MKRTIKNHQAKAKFSSVKVDVPANYDDALKLYGSKINEVLFAIAVKQSNFDVTLRPRIKSQADAQEKVTQYFTQIEFASGGAIDTLKQACIDGVNDGVLTLQNVVDIMDIARRKNIAMAMALYKKLTAEET